MTVNRVAIYHNLPKGGGLRIATELTKYLKNKMSVCDVYTLSEKELKPWRGFLFRNLWILIMLPRYHKELAEEIDKKNYDVVIVNHDYFTKAPYILKYLKTKKVYICHEPQREFYESWSFHAPYIKDKIANILRFPLKYVDQNNCKKADILLANSMYSKSILEKVYSKKTKVFYLGVEADRFKPLKLKKEKIILLIGGLSRVKGHDFVIRSLKDLLGEYRIVIIGDGRNKDLKYLKNIVPNKNKYIDIIEKITDDELIKFYNRALVHCIGAHLEPFGLSSLEAQSCETPVVAVDEGGYKESIIDGVSGYLTKRDFVDFKIKTILAIDNSKTLGKNGRKNILKKWTWKENIKKLDEILGI